MSTEQQNKMTADGTTPMWTKQIGSIDQEGYIRYLEKQQKNALRHICDNPSCDVVLENDYWEAFKDDGKVMCCSGCEEEPNKCDKCGNESYKYSTEICETLGDGYYCNDCRESDEDEEEEVVSRECFKCNKTYYDVEYSCCCGKCCSYCRESDEVINPYCYDSSEKCSCGECVPPIEDVTTE